MKSLILFALLTISSLSFAQSSFIDAREDLAVLGLVVTPHSDYSEANRLQASVVPLLTGDGMNAITMALVVSDGMGSSYVFELNERVYNVTSVNFTGVDIITVDYVQNSLDAAGNAVKVKGSVTVQALRYKNGTLSDSLKIIK